MCSRPSSFVRGKAMRYERRVDFFQVSDDDEEDDAIKPILPTHAAVFNRSKASANRTSLLNASPNHSRSKTNAQRDDDDDEADDEDEDDRSAPSAHETDAKNFQESLRRYAMTNQGAFDPSLLSRDDANANAALQMRLMQMLAGAAAGQPIVPDGNHVDSMMHTLANMQRNFMMKLINDPMAAAQMAQLAAAAASSTTHGKPNPAAQPSPTFNHKQSSSSSSGGRKRKSTPEKRVIGAHRSSDDNGEVKRTFSLVPIGMALHVLDFVTSETRSKASLDGEHEPRRCARTSTGTHFQE